MNTTHAGVLPETADRLRKAAVILATLERSQAVAILQALPSDLVSSIVDEIRSLGSVDPAEQDEAFTELAHRLEGPRAPRGGDEVAQQLLLEAMGSERASEMLGQQSPSLLDAIERVPIERIADLLKHELPAVTATILAFLPPDKTATILGHLDEKLKQTVVQRLSVQRSPQPEVIEHIERVFIERVLSMESDTQSEHPPELGGARFVADVLKNVDPSTEETLFNAVKEVSDEQASEIRKLMFTFEDVAELQDEDVQKALRQINLEQLVVALRGASDAVAQKLTQNLSKRAQEAMEEEAQMLGKVKRKDAEAQQENIVDLLRQLEADGEITLRSDGADDGYV